MMIIFVSVFLFPRVDEVSLTIINVVQLTETKLRLIVIINKFDYL